MKSTREDAFRSSWASSQRRRRSTDGAISSNGNASLYSKQINPYKQHSSSLRSGNTEFRYGRTRGDLDGVEFGLDVIDGQLNNDGDDDDDDDDDMKLDNILASIVDDSKGFAKKTPVEIKSNNSELIELINGCATAVTPIEATSSVVKSKDLYVTSVDFGKDTTHLSKLTSPTHRKNADSSNNEAGSISPVSEEDNDTFASAMLDDSESLIKRVAQSQSEPQPTFASSEGFEDAMRFESTRMPPISSFRLNEGNNGGSILGSESLLSIIEDGMNNYTKDKRVLTPPRGLYSAYSDRSHTQESTHLEDHPHIKSNNNAPQLIPASAKTNRKSSHSKATTQNHVGGVIVQNGADDETLSTVTDPAEAPFIFTYKMSHDDDSVSQITSSLAGSSSSPYQLQNVPSSTGMRNKNDSLSWMKSNSDGTRTGGMVIQGLYGRDRNRNSPNKGSRRNKGSSVSGSARSDSFNGANNSLDEIEYALNSDCKSGRKQRSNVIRRPFGRIGSASGFDDLSTVVSTNSRDSLQGDQQTVSRLGMGGISCAPPPMYSSTQSVYSEGTSDSSQSLGIIQQIALIAWKAQHHASRFFFPTSKAGRRKKSDDPLSDLEDILLEEGVNTMSHRRRGNGHNNAGDDDDIDYFSRAMNQNGSGGWRKSKKKKSESKTAKMGCLFCIMAITLSIYRMSLRESVNYIKQSNKRSFKTGVHGKDLHYDTKANDVNNEVYYGDDGGDRLGQLVKESDEQRKYPVQYEVQVPPVFDGLANVDDMLFQRGIGIPLYWHIPRSGGGTMNDVLGSCLHLTLAADAGGSQGHDQHEVCIFFHHKSYFVFSRAQHCNVSHRLLRSFTSPLRFPT